MSENHETSRTEIIFHPPPPRTSLSRPVLIVKAAWSDRGTLVKCVFLASVCRVLSEVHRGRLMECFILLRVRSTNNNLFQFPHGKSSENFSIFNQSVSATIAGTAGRRKRLELQTKVPEDYGKFYNHGEGPRLKAPKLSHLRHY